jgi:hypothetical protein
MAKPDPKADLHRYLQHAREALLWKLDGLSEYDARRADSPGRRPVSTTRHSAVNVVL